MTFILLIREIRVRLFCVINTYLRHLCAVIGIRVIREIRVRNLPPQTWLYFKFQLSSVFHGSLMAPALACIILHIEPPIYQPFSRNNVGMQAKKTFYFLIFQNHFCAPSKRSNFNVFYNNCPACQMEQFGTLLFDITPLFLPKIKISSQMVLFPQKLPIFVSSVDRVTNLI